MQARIDHPASGRSHYEQRVKGGRSDTLNIAAQVLIRNPLWSDHQTIRIIGQ
jgi:hypothetical protein